MQLTSRNLEDYDKLLETVQDISARLDRAQTDRTRLINERVKLWTQCTQLREQAAILEESVKKILLERNKLSTECDELRKQLDRANQQKKSFAVSAAASKGAV